MCLYRQAISCNGVVHFTLCLWTHTVECCYNVVQFIMVLQTALQWQQQNVNKTSNSQQAPHTSPSRVSSGVSIMINLKKIDCIILAPHCMYVLHDLCSPIHNVLWITLHTHWFPGTLNRFDHWPSPSTDWMQTSFLVVVISFLKWEHHIMKLHFL